MSAIFNPSANVEALLGGYNAGTSNAARGFDAAISQQHLALAQQQQQIERAAIAKKEQDDQDALNAYRGMNLDLLNGSRAPQVAGPRPTAPTPAPGMVGLASPAPINPVGQLQAIGQGTQPIPAAPAGVAAPAPSPVPPQEPSTIPAPEDDDTAKLRRMIEAGGLDAQKALYPYLQTKKGRANLLRRIESIRKSGLEDYLSDPKERAVFEAALAAEDPDKALQYLNQQIVTQQRGQDMLAATGMRSDTALGVAGIRADSQAARDKLTADYRDAQIQHLKNVDEYHRIKAQNPSATANSDAVIQSLRDHRSTLLRQRSALQHTYDAAIFSPDRDKIQADVQAKLDAIDGEIGSVEQQTQDAYASFIAARKGGAQNIPAPLQSASPAAPIQAAPAQPAAPPAPVPQAAPTGNVARQRAAAAAFQQQYPGVQFDPSNPQHIAALKAILSQIPTGAP